MYDSEQSFKAIFIEYDGDLAKDFKVEHGITIDHRIWGFGMLIDVKSREYGGWYLNVKFSNHYKMILSDTISSYFVKSMAINREYLSIYKNNALSEVEVVTESIVAPKNLNMIEDEALKRFAQAEALPDSV
ncbi:hypothetical protein VHA01S_016_00480 [Vibrio halioticoli NBRC 102217]|uniref:Uncharacterized protein n=1 Tax=Vibrio halioticoli NBRC 102217 TaxID=1219072 RepID=V5FH41_9VIBR|nr:hypothetical protein [Vibrio halioticoli]GAD89191.1 hypothetical protein VHA01S_016_00480 [Vibrio halioticoli NBRC 102217]